MNAVTKILSRILGKIPTRGTLLTPSGEEDYPIAISNEIMGGPFIVDSLDELKEIPVERLLKGCKCTVNEYNENGSVVPTTTYILKNIPSVKLSTIPQVNISDFWILDRPRQLEESALEFQYAPNYNGMRPPFLTSTISREAYNAGYGSDADYSSGDTGLIIWQSEYDPSIHRWVRQRTGSLADWGIPVRIEEGYEEGTYNDIRFKWREKVLGKPARPSSMIGGKLNNDPELWVDAPEIPGGISYADYIVTHDLWRINAIKGVYGDLLSEWSDPIRVSTDPNLVRYGMDASNNDYLNDTYWRGYYTIGDRYKASRSSLDSDWIVEIISGESGEYTDYVFKQFQDSYEPTIDDAPKTQLGYGVDGWKDGVFIADDGFTIYVSTSRKFSNGEMISPWTIPMRFDGKNTIRCIVTPIENSGNVFKHSYVNGEEVITPNVIKLKAKLYDAAHILDPSKYTVNWYIGDENTGTKVVSGVPGMPIISGVNGTVLEINDSHVDTSQVFTAVAFLQGEDYVDDITIYDVTDGVGYIPLIDSESGFTYKGSETKTFTGYLYENGVNISTVSGVNYSWKLNGTVISTDRDVDISDTQVEGIAYLHLDITFLGNTYSITEALTDVADGRSLERQYSALDPLVNMSYTPDTTGNPNQWSTSALNAVWVIERLTGDAWGAPYRVKGEKGVISGAFQKTVFRTRDPNTSPAWVTQIPTAKTDPNSNLVPSNWADTPPDNAPTGSTIYGSKATFTKNPANENTGELVSNWTIVGNWSMPFKVTYFPEAGDNGAPGTDGYNGWSPNIATVSSGELRVLQVKDWSGGTGAKPPINQYLGASGFTPNLAQAINIRGAQGAQGVKGNDGVFTASDFWDGNSVVIQGSNGSPNYESWNFTFRKTKAGIVHYAGRYYRGNANTHSRWVSFTMPFLWTSNMLPAILPNAASSLRVHMITNSGQFRVNTDTPEIGDNQNGTGNPYFIRLSSGSWQLRVRFVRDWGFVFQGSYPTSNAFSM